MNDIFNRSWSPYRKAPHEGGPDFKQQLMGILRNVDAAKLTKDKDFMRLLVPAMMSNDPEMIDALKQHIDQKVLCEMFER